MKIAGLTVTLLTAAFMSFTAAALPREKADFEVDIDLNEKLPPYEELFKKYVSDNKIVDRKYDYHWDIGNIFDAVFRMTISSYGQTEKRIKNEHEEDLVAMLKAFPPEYYQYIGPYLHTVPNMPESVLNMPGIKETKNQFPKRIAKELEGIEDLEFVSPYLYYVLMPESWPDYRDTMERVPNRPASVQVKHDPEFFEKLKTLVPEDEFFPDAPKKNLISSSDLRTLEPDKDSALTSADVKGVIDTLDGVNEFTKNLNNYQKIYFAGYLIDSWEKDQGKGLQISLLKDLVNPCQRLVQKVKYAGLERDFAKVVSREGFDIDGWAYTCDKTVKAYRVSMLTRSGMAAILAYKKGVYDKYLDILNEKTARMQYETMQGIIAMYQAPISDVLETRKNRSELRRKIIDNKRFIGNAPILIMK